MELVASLHVILPCLRRVLLDLPTLCTMRPPKEAGETDPAIDLNSLVTAAWRLMQNRLHIDTVFLMLFYVPSEWFARKIAYIAIDKETIDEFLHGVADFFTFVGEACKRVNYVIIDGVGDGIPRIVSGCKPMVP